ncbi:hypothetical protein [Bacillus safensis]|uniref:Uncharacterized protein n=1 Tax=Bacillus safensis TaxID=561879 RepID=A0A1L6ZPA7_BACIA|nr:hypothetical protein [Bacillus safensis]APT48354.1 hypothetical protein BSA145_21050 [Bacillus safensis]
MELKMDSIFSGLVALILIFGVMFVVTGVIHDKEENEILEKGKDRKALVIDKVKIKDNNIIPIVAGSVVIFNDNSKVDYSLKIDLDHKSYELNVNKRVFDEYEIGSNINVKLFDGKVRVAQ